MAIRRDNVYVWVSWLARLLVGDASREWASRFKAHRTARATAHTTGEPDTSLRAGTRSVQTRRSSCDARPRREKARKPHTWWTRPDPFEGVWCEILDWLQCKPDATGRELLDRLICRHPERFKRSHLRALQRRVRQWRRVWRRSWCTLLVNGVK